MASTTKQNAIEAELATPRGSDGELAFEVDGVEFGLELERIAPPPPSSPRLTRAR